jgi:hypothetical protein
MQYVGQCLTDFNGGGQFGKHWRAGYELPHRKRIARDNNEGNAQGCEELDNRHAWAIAEVVIDDRCIDVVRAKIGERALVAWFDRVRGAKAAEPKVVVGSDDGIVLDHEDLLAVKISSLIPRIVIATEHCGTPRCPAQPFLNACGRQQFQSRSGTFTIRRDQGQLDWQSLKQLRMGFG